GFHSLISGAALTNAGTISMPAGSGIRYLRVPLINKAGATVTVGAADARQDSATTTTNSGTFTVPAGGSFALSSNAVFNQSAGTLTDNGFFGVFSATFNQKGGAESGHPIVVQSSTLNDLV